MTRPAPLPPHLLRSLIQPLYVGRRVAGDVVLESMRFSSDGCQLEYGLSGGVVVVVDHQRETTPWVTDRFAVSIRGRGRRLLAAESAAVQVIIALISRNEGRTDPESQAVPQSRQPRAEEGATLFLVPGHLGRSTDLTLRALQVLASTRYIFVETGQGTSARDTLTQFQVLDPRTEIIEYDGEPSAAERLVELLRAGHDVALFGATEGIPCFIDPGHTMVDAATEFGARIRSVGGASVLGMALMRATGKIQSFVFLGHLDTVESLERAEPLLARVDPSETAAFVFFVPSRGLRGALERVARRLRGRDLSLLLLCDLTTDAERAIEVPLDSVLQEGAVDLPDDTCGGAVAIVRPERGLRTSHGSTTIRR